MDVFERAAGLMPVARSLYDAIQQHRFRSGAEQASSVLHHFAAGIGRICIEHLRSSIAEHGAY
jgi:hypothetical protein